MLENKAYQASHKLFDFAAMFVTRRTKHKKKASRTRVHTCYSDIFADMTGHMEWRVCSEEELDDQKGKVKKFQKTL